MLRNKILLEFLHEYEDIADGNVLMEKQKVEMIIHYISIPCAEL